MICFRNFGNFGGAPVTANATNAFDIKVDLLIHIEIAVIHVNVLQL